MRLDLTIAALGDPARRELVRRLARRPCRAGELARGFDDGWNVVLAKYVSRATA